MRINELRKLNNLSHYVWMFKTFNDRKAKIIYSRFNGNIIVEVGKNNGSKPFIGFNIISETIDQFLSKSQVWNIMRSKINRIPEELLEMILKLKENK